MCTYVLLLEFNKASTAHMHLRQDDSEAYCYMRTSSSTLRHDRYELLAVK